MKARKLAKKGRLRKEASRRNGRVVQEDPRKVVLEQPHRRVFRSVKLEGEAKPRDRRADDRAHDVFGRLLLSGEISQAQYEAGVTWLEAYIAFARVKGIPLGRLRGTLAQTIKGHDNSDMSVYEAHKIVDRFARISAALLETLGLGAQEARDVLVNTLVHDKLPTQWSLGVMREALNIIGRQP